MGNLNNMLSACGGSPLNDNSTYWALSQSYEFITIRGNNATPDVGYDDDFHILRGILIFGDKQIIYW